MKEKTYSFYTITTPDGMVFVGMTSGDPNKRFYPKLFSITSLNPYIEQWGWDMLEKKVVKGNLTKEEAQELVLDTSSFCRENGVLINKRVQVPESMNPNRNNEYQRRWREAHREEFNRRVREYYYSHRDLCIARQMEYNRRKKERTENEGK